MGIISFFTKLMGNNLYNDTEKAHEILRPKADLLDTLSDRITHRVPKIDDSVEVYSYIKVPITDVQREMLLKMYNEKNWNVTFELDEYDRPKLMYEGNYIAHLKDEKKEAMVCDWLKRNDVIRCEVTGTHMSSEHIVLAFYRNEEERLKNHKSEIIKLTSFSSEAKQENISMLTNGEKLEVSEDDYVDGKVIVTDYTEEPIGNLPSKYSKIFFDEGFSGVFFHHTTENDNGKLIPFIKIFYR